MMCLQFQSLMKLKTFGKHDRIWLDSFNLCLFLKYIDIWDLKKVKKVTEGMS